ncbi:unnamed protein product [Pleuronectes platessa]|uniref:Uncharacterized protein n=1 Tax=Pleuronectes platessa TaxID=8262 RepID=A0A9N7UUI6_PLEPL|nr:unnamed protein product [Pleuronectes platessa]
MEAAAQGSLSLSRGFLPADCAQGRHRREQPGHLHSDLCELLTGWDHSLSLHPPPHPLLIRPSPTCCTSRPTNQPTSQPIKQPASQPINQPASQPINQPASETAS